MDRASIFVVRRLVLEFSNKIRLKIELRDVWIVRIVNKINPGVHDLELSSHMLNAALCRYQLGVAIPKNKNTSKAKASVEAINELERLRSSMQRGQGDDGPKLREEKNFEDFYANLDKETLLPIISSDDGGSSGSHELDGTISAWEQNRNLKQLICNGKSTFETIKLHKNSTKFQECQISISQLDGSELLLSQREKKSRRARDKAKTEFDELKTPYYTKFSLDSDNGTDPHLAEKLEHISKNLANLTSEYDMDEQDDLYVQFLNQGCCDSKLSHEFFELLISVLEKEWSHLETLIPPKSTLADESVSDHRKQTAQLHYQLFGADDGTERSADQTCAVCGGGDSDNSNAIVFCDGCDIAVHQECYGIVFIPEGQWLCRRCLVSKNRKVSCLFCASHTGAFKQTDTGSWAHVLCGLWIPELYFANLHYMEPIEGTENISKSRWKLLCSICKQRMGACIQCTNRNCFVAFHVTCAKRAGLYMDFGGASISEVASNQLQPSHVLSCFCEKHSPPDWPSPKEGILKVRRYFAEYNENDIAETFNMKQQLPNSVSTKTKWKTNRGTPIAPHIFAVFLREIISLLGVPNSQQVSYYICRYWSMKRELKRGAPLVRKYTSNSSSLLDENQLQERVDATDILMKDLEALKKLSTLTKRRTAVLKDLRDSKENIRFLTQSPEDYMFKHLVVDKFIKSEPFRNLEHQVKEEASLSLLQDCKYYAPGSMNTTRSYEAKVNSALMPLEMSSSTTRGVHNNIRKARLLLAKLLKQYEAADVTNRFQSDFIIDNDKVVVKRRRASILMEQEGLSDVEELNPKERKALSTLLKESFI